LSENMADAQYCGNITYRFMWIDGYNLASSGDPRALELTREILRNGVAPYMAFRYLSLKGDEKDIELFENAHEFPHGHHDYSAADALWLLRERQTENVFWCGLYPSVANTGPQAVYLIEILKKISMKKEYLSYDESEALTMFWELAAMMEVSFDEDGTPVSNVDLAKYGVSMPVITPKPHPSIPYSSQAFEHPQYTVIFPHEIENAQFTTITETIIDKSQPTNAPSTDALDTSRDISSEQRETPVKKSKIYWIGILVLAIMGGIVVGKITRREKNK